MKLSTLLVISTLAFASVHVVASEPGHGHSHPAKIDEAGAIAVANQVVTKLVKQQHNVEGAPLDNTWTSIPDSDKKISKKGAGYYIVGVTHAASAKTLYILISDTGVVFDLNYSGNFPGLKE